MNDEVANSLKDADVVNQARDYWYEKVNQGVKSIKDGLTNFKGENRIDGTNFGLKGLHKAGLDPIEQFIGSMSPEITSDGTTLTFTIINVTSFRSASYRAGTSSEGGAGGNFRQTFIITEPIDFNRIKQ